MNFVYLSPHFPPNFYLFSVHLRKLGATVLGLADEHYEMLRPELRQSINEYYRVNDMHNYEELLRALGYYTHRYGKIDRLDSLNEYWLETEAQLRTDFNIPGIKNDQIGRIKQKSKMKDTFRKAGIEVARGRVVHTLQQAHNLINEIGFPVVAKPDIGVGAAKTYKIQSEAELVEFFRNKPPMDYIVEEFVDGIICSFDGLTNREGDPVFYTGHQYSQGIMETVNNNDLIYYYSFRNLPDDLEQAGHKVLRTYDVRERFFHFEFFRRKRDQKIVALEVNMRPPGGLTTDMFNYANDIDIYAEWANIVVNNEFTASYTRPYHCAYISRKFNRQYTHSHSELIGLLGKKLVHHESISGVFSAALGDQGYLIRTPELDEVHEIAHFIQE
jgi:biotin carboxylase